MKRTLGLMAAVHFSLFSASAFATDDDITHYIIPVETDEAFIAAHPITIFPPLPPLPPPLPIPGGGSGSGISIFEIINTAQQIWSIIEENKPVIDVSYDYANGFPKGITDSLELAEFSTLQYSSYQVYGKNKFGMQVYSLTMTLIHRFGGNYEGEGKYLDTVAIIPSDLQASWGYTVNFEVVKTMTANVGTREKPVASLALEAILSVSNVVKSSRRAFIWEFNGSKETPRLVNPKPTPVID